MFPGYLNHAVALNVNGHSGSFTPRAAAGCVLRDVKFIYSQVFEKRKAIS